MAFQVRPVESCNKDACERVDTFVKTGNSKADAAVKAWKSIDWNGIEEFIRTNPTWSKGDLDTFNIILRIANRSAAEGVELAARKCADTISQVIARLSKEALSGATSSTTSPPFPTSSFTKKLGT